MQISFWKCFAIFGVVSRWADKALADGRITLVEALQLIGELAALLGVDTLFDVPKSDADLTLTVAGESSEDPLAAHRNPSVATVGRE